MPIGFVFLPSYYNAIRVLSDTERLEMYDAIMQYAFEGELPVLDPVPKAMFELLRPNIDSSIKRYTASVENGKKGGRPPKKT